MQRADLALAGRLDLLGQRRPPAARRRSRRSPRTRDVQRPNATPRPRPGSPRVFDAPAAARGEHRAARPVEVAGDRVEHVDEPATRSCRTPASSCRSARRPRRVGARRARARAARIVVRVDPVAAGDGLGREVRRELAHLVEARDVLGDAPASSRPSAKSTWTSANSSSASVPGRMKRCSSASLAVRVRRGSTTTILPPRARIARRRPRTSGAVISEPLEASGLAPSTSR